MVRLVRGGQSIGSLAADADKVFAWGELTFSEVFSPAGQVSLSANGYRYRNYTGGHTLFVNESGIAHLYYIGPLSGNARLDLGLLSDWVVQATTVTPTVSATCSSSNFTRAKFDAIAEGMTIDQVSQTIGCTPFKDYTGNTFVNHQPGFAVIYWTLGEASSYPMIAVYFNPSTNLVYTTFLGTKLAVGF